MGQMKELNGQNQSHNPSIISSGIWMAFRLVLLYMPSSVGLGCWLPLKAVWQGATPQLTANTREGPPESPQPQWNGGDECLGPERGIWEMYHSFHVSGTTWMSLGISYSICLRLRCSFSGFNSVMTKLWGLSSLSQLSSLYFTLHSTGPSSHRGY